MTTEVAPGVHRLGNAVVNFYLVEDGDGLTLVDAGIPRMQRNAEAALAARGRTLADLDAIVLTHAHPDHTGFAEAARRAGVAVWVHELDAELARTSRGQKREAKFLPYLRHRATWKVIGTFAAGGLPRRIREVRTYADGATDLPAGLRPIHTPGHSHGHCALHLPERGALLTGDALCGWNPLTGRQGAQIMPSAFNTSTQTAMRSLDRLEGLDASTVLFGHGEPWTDGIASAVARARAAGPS